MMNGIMEQLMITGKVYPCQIITGSLILRVTLNFSER